MEWSELFPRWRVGTVAMRVAALLLAGGVGIATAQAQSGGTRVEFLPMPNTLPLLFFAPDSLAGTMLEPLTIPKGDAEAPAAERLAAIPDEPASEAPPLRPAMAEGDTEPTEEPPAETDTAEAVPAEEPDAAEMASVEEPDVGEAAPLEQPEPPASLSATIVHVIVENVESSSGTVNVAVCDTDFTPEGCPYKASVPATAGFVEAQFDDVPPGSYAVVGYHDVNDNDEFDKFLGVPREPYALSGGAANEMVPEFSDAVLNINQGENYVIIRMKRLGSG
jgi:uncharacterized protein (DUF2141 family)